MHFFLIVFVLTPFFFISCNLSPPRPEEFKIADKIAVQNRKKLKNEGFIPFCSGEGNRNNINSYIQGYYTNKQRFTSIDQARCFIVEKVEDFIKPFNEEKRIRIRLANFPFAGKNADLYFDFLDDEGKHLEEPYIAGVSSYEGEVRYYYWDKEKKREKLFHREPYETAYAIYQKECISSERK